jgi:hypothetical protein
VTTKNAVFWDVTPCGSCQNTALFNIASSFDEIYISLIVYMAELKFIYLSFRTYTFENQKEFPCYYKGVIIPFFSSLLKSWITQNFITIKTSWNTND